MGIMTFRLARERAKAEKIEAAGDEGLPEAVIDFIEARTDLDPEAVADGVEISLTKAGKLTKATEKALIEKIEAAGDEG